MTRRWLITHLLPSQPSLFHPSPQPRPENNPRDGLSNQNPQRHPDPHPALRLLQAPADIILLRVDAIVNAANSSLLGGGGVDGAIHRAAGPELVQECSRLDGCPTGQARITAGYDLPAKHVIHTVGPVYSHGDPGKSDRLLRDCYRKSLELAAQSGVRTVAFSCISTGVYGYPSRDAAEAACETVRDYLEKDTGAIETVVFVTFEEKDRDAYQATLPIYFPPPPRQQN
ncbi:hypothetical protein XA68_14428 [Ophiocordyceps unilateralis]|uniref:Macro domain-containing protein n=1 Tax=Ophiocordyceps unilateralis TaxID=268505 RepID=A0A2A9PAG4_OPHUN|nr:hypothetical protein XA68_14428 [Ophiocordyceps unilateralis]